MSPKPHQSWSSSFARRLIDGGFISAHGYGKGFPLLRQSAVHGLRELTALFIERMAGGRPCERVQPDLLLPAEEYRREVEAVGGFDNCFEIDLGGRRAVLRPDAAVHNLRLLAKRGNVADLAQVCAVFQGFRSVSGATLSLYRDRFIHPFVQFNQVVPGVALEAELQAVFARLCGFFETLCLPVRIVDFGPWKGYARRLFVAVAQLPDGEPTVVSMVYVVGDTYRRLAGLADNVEALDIGITQKVLAVLIMRHADQRGVRLPACVAPVQLVISRQAAEALGDLGLKRCAALRTKFVNNQRAATLRKWTRAGAILQLYRGRRGLRMFSRSLGWSSVSHEPDFDAALGIEDTLLWKEACARDMEAANPPLLAAGDKVPETGRVVHLPSTLIAQLPGLSLPAAWTGPRVFY